MTLYDITDDIKAWDQLFEEATEATADEEGNPKEPDGLPGLFCLRAMRAELETNGKGKAEGWLKYRASLLAFIEGSKPEEERIYKRRKIAENKVKWIDKGLECFMQLFGVRKMTAGTFSMTIQKNPPYAFITNEKLLPEDYLRIIPEKREPDKKLILDALKAGQEVPGAVIGQGESLRVR